MATKSKKATEETSGSDGMNTQERIDRLNTIRARIHTIKTIEVQQKGSIVAAATTAAREAGLEALRYNNENIDPETKKVYEDLQWRLDELNRQAVAKEEAQAAAEREYAELTQELADLETELANFEYVARAEDVFRYQESLKHELATVANLEAAIASQRDVILAAKARLMTPEDLGKKREDLLAEISLGNATEESLRALDAEIEDQKKNHQALETEVSKVVKPAEQAIAGLRRKLDQAEGNVRALRSQENDIMLQFLMSRAELAGEKYMSLADELFSAYDQLVALDREISRRDGNKSSGKILGMNYSELAIPTFNLRSHLEARERVRGNYGLIKADWYSTRRYDAALEAEKEAIRLLGVEI